MNLSLSLNDIYKLLAGLSIDNKRWLAEKLIVDVTNEDAETHTLEFPHIPRNRPVSQEVLDMVVGKLPKNFDVEKETERMWEEFAR